MLLALSLHTIHSIIVGFIYYTTKFGDIMFTYFEISTDSLNSRSIVEALRGDIHISSELSRGTHVQVTFPLQRTVRYNTAQSPEVSHSDMDDGRIPLALSLSRNKTVALCRREKNATPLDTSYDEMLDIVHKYLTSWFHMHVVIYQPYSEKPTADVALVDESDERRESKDTEMASHMPKIVMQHRHSWEARRSGVSSGGILLLKPVGPRSLANALISALEQGKSTDEVAREKGSRVEGNVEEKTEGDVERDEENSPKHTSQMSVALRPKTPSSSNDTPSTPISTPNTKSEPTKEDSLQQQHSKEQERTFEEPRILLVDDNPINLKLLHTFVLRHARAHIDTAKDGKLALDQVLRRERNYAVIFMDLSMPVMDGFEATRFVFCTSPFVFTPFFLCVSTLLAEAELLDS